MFIILKLRIDHQEQNKMEEEINRIVVLEKNVKADLHRCNICHINFTAIQLCMMCDMIMEKEKELGRKITKEEYDKLFDFLK